MDSITITRLNDILPDLRKPKSDSEWRRHIEIEFATMQIAIRHLKAQLHRLESKGYDE